MKTKSLLSSLVIGSALVAGSIVGIAAPASAAAPSVSTSVGVQTATGSGSTCWWVPTYYNWFRGGYVRCGHYNDKPWWAN